VNNTVKFYTGFAIALALLMSLAYAAGYRMGFERARRYQASVHASPIKVVVPKPSPSATP
jgi:hypothetical protein